MNNMIWRDDYFHIEATSKQIQHMNEGNPDPSDDSYYSKITINGDVYCCFISLGNNIFGVTLYDEISNKAISFYGDNTEGENEEFIWGFYGELKKSNNEEYSYSLPIDLLEEGQYYQYCMANNLTFPKDITLLGYGG